MIKKYILSFFVCLSLFVCSFTTVTLADTQPYILTRNNILFNQTNAIPAVLSPDYGEESESFVVGKATIDNIFYSDIRFSNSYRVYSDGVVTNFNFKPMTCTYQERSAMLAFDDFVGANIYIYLPTIQAYNSVPQPIFSNTFEWVSIQIGADYGSVQDLFLNTTAVHHKNFSSWHSTDGTYWHFMVDTRGSRLDSYYVGSYSNYTGSDYLAYIFEAYHWLTTRNNAIPLLYTDWLYDIDFFPGALTFEDKAELEKLDDLSNKLTNIDGSINDIKDILNQAPSVPIETPPTYEIPDTGEDKFLDDADKVLDDLNNYKDSIINQFPTLSDNLFGQSGSVIRSLVQGSFDVFTYRITDSTTGVDFSPVMTIIYLSFIIGIIAIVRG